ncbi:MAG: class I SAM-dependent methyltransferase [Clostridia bacterium]|nr:class I SAM-dependent methyltransferase [Clostridia bacterium]
MEKKIRRRRHEESAEQHRAEIVRHYDALIDENNDPVQDPAALKAYMDGWDGDVFMDALHLSKEKSVLEIGVGTGRLAVKTAPQCKLFYGVDLSLKTIERAKNHLKAFQNVHLICGDFLSCEFNRTFDVIYSSLTFMHIIEKEAAIRKAANLLNENGRFVLSIDKSQATVLRCGERELILCPDHPDRISKSMKAAGLKRIEQRETVFAWIMIGEKAVSA